jgi:hypothetical protein
MARMSSEVETCIAALLRGLEPLLKPSPAIGHKWHIVSSTRHGHQAVQRPVMNEPLALSFSYGRAMNQIAALPTYEAARQAFTADSITSDGPRLAGYHATFDRVLQYLICGAGKTREARVQISHSKATELFRAFRTILGGNSITLHARARLLGARLTRKRLVLSESLDLYRLSTRERNERAVILDAHSRRDWDDSELLNYTSEVRQTVTVKVERNKESAFFRAHDEGAAQAVACLSTAMDAVLVAARGDVTIGPVDIRGGLPGMPTGRSRLTRTALTHLPFPGLIALGAANSERLRTAYAIMSGGNADTTLARALHRFVLGRQRVDLIDRVVDYVIAWEAILLTQNGQAVMEELAYRFALNGTAVLVNAGKERDRPLAFRRMKSAYSLRSAIVHGGGEKVLGKAIKPAGFVQVSQVCEFLEEGFRSALFWLLSTKREDRPYRYAGGWENLTWGIKVPQAT